MPRALAPVCPQYAVCGAALRCSVQRARLFGYQVVCAIGVLRAVSALAQGDLHVLDLVDHFAVSLDDTIGNTHG